MEIELTTKPEQFHIYLDNYGFIYLYIGNTSIGTHVLYEICGIGSSHIIIEQIKNRETKDSAELDAMRRHVRITLYNIFRNRIEPDRIKNIVNTNILRTLTWHIGKVNGDLAKNWIIKNNLFGGSAIMNDALKNEITHKESIDLKDAIIGKTYYVPISDFELGGYNEEQEFKIYFGEEDNKYLFMPLRGIAFDSLCQFRKGVNKLNKQDFFETLIRANAQRLAAFSEFPDIFLPKMYKEQFDVILTENCVQSLKKIIRGMYHG